MKGHDGLPPRGQQIRSGGLEQLGAEASHRVTEPPVGDVTIVAALADIGQSLKDHIESFFGRLHLQPCVAQQRLRGARRGASAGARGGG